MNKTEKMRLRWPAASGPHPLTLLPSEIRGKIFNKLKQPEAYKLRLVCKQWNEDVKDFYNFAINFNEDSPGLTFILKLRIARLKLRKLVPERFRILPVPDAEIRQLRSGRVLQGLHDVTFKYPNCLGRVTISYFLLYKPQNMPANALKEILQLCQKSVTRLEIRLDSPMFIYQFQSSIRFQFRNLKRLDLKFDSKTAGLFQNDSILHLLKTSGFPSLSYLKVKFSHLDNISKTAIAVAFILTLLTKNPKGLEQVSLKMSNYSDYRYTDTQPEVLAQLPAPEVPNLESLKTVTDLKQIRFYVHFLEASTNMKLLLQLLPRQRVLEKLFLGMNFECSPTLLSSILLNNSETIVDVNIRILNVNSEAPFDISVLKNCQKLKRLCLHRNFDTAFLPVGSGPELINCRDFPASLIHLSFEGIRILSQDLVALLQSDLLLRLEKLCLWGCGDSGDCGINLAVLKQLGRLKAKIKKNLELMKMNFRGFNCSGPKEEVGKIKAAMRKLGTGNEYFRRWLLRDDDEDNTDVDDDPTDPPVLAVRWCRKEGNTAGLWTCSVQGFDFMFSNYFDESENSE